MEPAREEAREQLIAPDLINRELGWLEFNRRVLHEALDDRTPLLERLKFLAIFSSNLDEFFMKRVGGLKRQLAAGVTGKRLEGKSPTQQIAAIREKVLPLLEQQAQCFAAVLQPRLRQEGVLMLNWAELEESDLAFAGEYFDRNVLPVLTPLAVDPGHPFPFLSNLSLSWGVTLRHPDREEKLFARVKVPQVLPLWVRLPPEKSEEVFRFVRLQDIIRANLEKLFPHMVILGVMLFRITRNADIERDEEDVEDLLEMIEDELRRRRFAQVVRLEIERNPDPWMLEFLLHELELGEDDVYQLPGEIDFTALSKIVEIDYPELKYEPWTPAPPAAFAEEEKNIFSIVRQGDVLVHHPYESFSASVERFFRTAVDDPRVVAIKMTLYRTGDESPFVPLLIRAAEAGKQVVCLVEVKAYFDEERNILWAQTLEDAGVHVVYGVVGLKTHCKTMLIVRQETEGLVCYAHIGTGNYHSQTAKLYTDLGLFTARKEITAELVDLFHYLTGRSLKRDYRRLLVAPINMKERFLEMIEREIEHRRAGRPVLIRAKINSLEDQSICKALYRASQAGVPIDLIVRGFCYLRAGLPEVSENIRVISVLGRFLEHSRIFYFRNGAENTLDGEVFIGSADWMHRNLHSRVEAIVPIEERALKERCLEILDIMLADERQAWEMRPDGSYEQRNGEGAVGSHRTLMNLARGRSVSVGQK